LKKEKTKTDPKKKEKLKSTACGVFGCFAGHRRRRETEKKETIPIYQLAGLHRRWRVRPTRRHCSGAQKPPTLFTRGYTVPDSVLGVVL
jgi:hypothetical protein